MAVKNSVPLTDQSGRSIPAGNIIISEVTFPIPTRQFDEKGKFKSVQRVIRYVFQFYSSVTSIKTQADKPIADGVKELPMGWARIMTEEEYQALQLDGSLAEVWLKDYVQSVIGGISSVIDPYK